MATIRFTDDDRDSRGFIRLSPPLEEATPAPEDAAPPPMRRAAPAPAPAARVPMPRSLISLIGGGLIGLVLIGLTIRFGAVPQPIMPPRAATVPSAAPAAAARAPIPQRPTPGVAMLPAYGAPNEAPRWQIEATRVITPLAHFGSDWIQADVAGSGVIWLRAADWPQLGMVGADLAVRPTAPPIPPEVPMVATPPPPPPPCAQTGIPGKMVEVCDDADLSVLQEQAKAKWIETYGGNAGVVITPSPQEWNR